MAEIVSVNYRPADLAARMERCGPESARPRSADESRVVATEQGDRVELSEVAKDYDPELAAARAWEERRAEIRARIADDTYLTPDKIDAVVERLYEDVVRGTDD